MLNADKLHGLEAMLSATGVPYAGDSAKTFGTFCASPEADRPMACVDAGSDGPSVWLLPLLASLQLWDSCSLSRGVINLCERYSLW